MTADYCTPARYETGIGRFSGWELKSAGETPRLPQFFPLAGIEVSIGDPLPNKARV